MKQIKIIKKKPIIYQQNNNADYNEHIVIGQSKKWINGAIIVKDPTTDKWVVGIATTTSNYIHVKEKEWED